MKPETALLIILMISSCFGAIQISTCGDIEFPPVFPHLFVYPQNITAAPGDTVTVYICIFNLSANIYKTNVGWQPGEPPPPYYENGIHVYPLGYLLGFDIKFRWDPTILEYINHTVTVPVEDYPDPIPPLNFTGTLHKPLQDVKEEINATEGTIWIAKAHMGMDYYNGNGTIAIINFKVKREGATPLEIYEAKLATSKLIVQQDYPEANKDQIIFTVGNGYLRTLGARTRIYHFDVKAAVNEKRFNPPIIEGENASITVTMKNEGFSTDLYNLTIYHTDPSGATYSIKNYTNVSIDGGRNVTEEIIVPADQLAKGYHTFTLNASILHGDVIYRESKSVTIRVVSAELQMDISWTPEHPVVGQNVTFTVSANYNEPDLTLNFTWKFYEQPPTSPTFPAKKILKGQSVSYSFPSAKNWTIRLIATNSLGVTWDPDRPATSSFMKDVTIEVSETTEARFRWDLVLLAIIVIAIIAAVAFYLYRQRR